MERVPPGREVRCARCITLWTPVPLEQVLAEQSLTRTIEMPPDIRPEMHPEPVLPRLPEAVPPPVFMEEPGPAMVEMHDAATPPPVRRDWRLAVAWMLTLAVLGGLGWLAVTQRAALIKAWPPSERAYIAFGLAPRH